MKLARIVFAINLPNAGPYHNISMYYKVSGKRYIFRIMKKSTHKFGFVAILYNCYPHYTTSTSRYKPIFFLHIHTIIQSYVSHTHARSLSAKRLNRRQYPAKVFVLPLKTVLTNIKRPLLVDSLTPLDFFHSFLKTTTPLDVTIDTVCSILLLAHIRLFTLKSTKIANCCCIAGDQVRR